MKDETIHSLQEEVVNEAQTNEEITQETNTGKVAQPTKQEWEERNMAALREKALRAERERDEALRYAREIEAKTQKQPVEEDDDFSLGADEIAEGKHLTKVQKKIKALENKIEKYERQSQTTSVESKIRYNYPDFESVVSASNLEQLRNTYPELAQTIHSSTDEYSRAAAAYTLIKKLGINGADSYDAEKQRIATNAAKPRPLASIPAASNPGGALAQANGFDKLSKDQMASYWKEMEEARKAY